MVSHSFTLSLKVACPPREESCHFLAVLYPTKAAGICQIFQPQECQQFMALQVERAMGKKLSSHYIKHLYKQCDSPNCAYYVCFFKSFVQVPPAIRSYLIVSLLLTIKPPIYLYLISQNLYFKFKNQVQKSSSSSRIKFKNQFCEIQISKV